MVYSWLRHRSTPRTITPQNKPAPQPSHLSSLLHTTLTTILPLLFFTTFVIAGTIVLNYSLSLNKPVPAHYVVGISASFAALIGLSICVFVWSRARGVRNAGKKKHREEDIERSFRAQPRRPHLFPTVTTDHDYEPERSEPRTYAFPPTPTPFGHRQNDYHANIIAHPNPTYRGLPQPLQYPPPPRRGSFELSAIPERSNKSNRATSPPFDPHTAYHQPQPPPQAGRRQPLPSRSPSVASLPESLRAPGRGAEAAAETRGQGQAHGKRTYAGMGPGQGVGLGMMAIPGLAAGPVQLPMPSVPEPLRFGASITGRGGGEGAGGRGEDEMRRLVKGRGRGMGVM